MAKAPKEKSMPPVFGEIAGTGSGLDEVLTAFVGEVMETTDPLLRSLGGDLEQYERLLRDDQVYSTFQQRRSAVTSAEWEVVAGGESAIDKAAAEHLEEQLRAIKFDRITDKMLHGLFYGYAVGEVMWGRRDNRIVIEDIKVRKPRRFRFGKDGRLRLMQAGKPEGVEMPDRKFWTFTAGADNDDEPYGRGLGYWCYWPVFLKRNGVKFWAIALEKYATPTPVGKYPPGSSPEDQKKLLQAAAAVSTDAAVVIPEGMILELLEAKRQAGSDHGTFVDEMNSMISKIVLSQTMTTDDGSSLSQANVHKGVRDEVVKGDADISCESFNNGPAVWVTAWNFPGAKPPKVWRILAEPEDLKEAAETDKILNDIGFKPSAEYVRDKYGEGYEFKEPPPGDRPPAEPPADFADPPRDPADDIAEQAEAFAAPAMDALIDQVKKLLHESPDLETFRDRLLELYPNMETSDLAEAMRRALVVSDLTGRADAIDG